MSGHVRALLSRLRRETPRGEVFRGTADRVIRVKDPIPGVFREAIFLLCEDYWTRGTDEQTLLREARQAAAGYLRER